MERMTKRNQKEIQKERERELYLDKNANRRYIEAI